MRDLFALRGERNKVKNGSGAVPDGTIATDNPSPDVGASSGVLWSGLSPIYTDLDTGAEPAVRPSLFKDPANHEGSDDDQPNEAASNDAEQGPRRLRFDGHATAVATVDSQRVDEAKGSASDIRESDVIDLRSTPARVLLRSSPDRPSGPDAHDGGRTNYKPVAKAASLPYGDAHHSRTVRSMEPVSDDRLELGHYLAILKRRWRWLVGPVVLITLAATVLNLRQQDTFQSSATVSLSASSASQVIDGGPANVGAANREIENEIAFARSDVVEALVRDQLGTVPVGVSINSTESADVLVFRARASSAERAANNANVWAQAFVQAKQEQSIASTQGLVSTFEENLEQLVAEGEELRTDLDRIEDQLAAATQPSEITRLQRQRDREERRIRFQLDLIETEVGAITQAITQLQISGQLLATGDIQVLRVAAPPTQPINAPLWQSGIIGLFAGIMLGVGAAFLRNSLDQAVKSSSDLHTLGLPVLGSVPRPPRHLRDAMDTVLATNPDSPQAEGFNEIRASLQYLAMSQDLTSILVTSANAGEGKTVTTANLALSMAHVNQLTLAADVDLRRPRLHVAFGEERAPGVVDHFLNNTLMEDLVHKKADLSENLYFIAAGTPTPRPGDLLATRQFLNTLMSLEKQADIVLMDGPPVLPVADPQALARSADGAVICVRAGKTRKAEVKAAVEKLNKAGANVVGAILTDVAHERSYKDYYAEG